MVTVEGARTNKITASPKARPDSSAITSQPRDMSRSIFAVAGTTWARGRRRHPDDVHLLRDRSRDRVGGGHAAARRRRARHAVCPTDPCAFGRAVVDSLVGHSGAVRRTDMSRTRFVQRFTIDRVADDIVRLHEGPLAEGGDEA